MGGGGVPSGGVTPVYGRRGDLPKSGKPNSRADLYVDGKKVQSRWYDHEGRVIRNRITIIRMRITHILFHMITIGFGKMITQFETRNG